MGLLDKLIKDAVGSAVSDAVKKAVQPKADEMAANVVSQAANALTQTANQTAAAAGAANQAAADAQAASGTEAAPSKEEMQAALGTLETLFGGLAQRAAENMKICPKCGEGASADKDFCPSCGTKLPDMTVADGAKCTKCGRQNEPGTRFCSGCGEKLPAAAAAEQAAAEADAAVLKEWTEKLPDFPVWSCGGSDMELEQETGTETESWRFSVTLVTPVAAQNAVKQYRQVLMQNGFKTEGQYPDEEHLYKRVNGVSCHVDTEHCFQGDADSPTIYFDHSQPTGGYDYKKPEKKQSGGLLGALFG